MKTIALTCCLFFAIAAGPTAHSQTAPAQPEHPPTTPTGQARSAPADDELQSLEIDVAKMRGIILQMQNNLGFIGTTTTPLRHQFELEISLWQLQLDQMQRHITSLRKMAGQP